MTARHETRWIRIIGHMRTVAVEATGRFEAELHSQPEPRLRCARNHIEGVDRSVRFPFLEIACNLRHLIGHMRDADEGIAFAIGADID